MHGFRILERPRMPCCAESPPVTLDEDDAPTGFYCTEPAGHTAAEHVARLDGRVLWRWTDPAPYPPP